MIVEAESDAGRRREEEEDGRRREETVEESWESWEVRLRMVDSVLESRLRRDW